MYVNANAFCYLIIRVCSRGAIEASLAVWRVALRPLASGSLFLPRVPFEALSLSEMSGKRRARESLLKDSSLLPFGNFLFLVKHVEPQEARWSRVYL
jgi:hypothetical protein